jgi:hypothetical protein
MVQQLKLSVWTAAISSSASIGQPIAFNSPATLPIIAALLRFLSEVVWQSLPEAWRHPYRPERHYMRGPGPKWRERHGSLQLLKS